MASMSLQRSIPIPTEINLDRKTHILDITFDDGAHFKLSCEYLRAFSPAAEDKIARSQGQWITGKRHVNIDRIEPMGNYAVQLIFDDGHDTGIYSWQTLYELGQNRQQNWQRYLDQVGRANAFGAETSAAKRVRLLFFAGLAARLGLNSQEVTMPTGVNTVSQLLAWLRERGGEWFQALAEENITITVNKQFVSPDTLVRSGDEISLTLKTAE
jgi:DUF971 family protein/molybdopterin converting factor small subunit